MEQRLIDANALKVSFRKQIVNVFVYDPMLQEKIKKNADAIIEAICKDIDLAPTVDAVPVVRCRECKYFKDGMCYNPNTYDDEKTCGNTTADWFCADGKRKEKEKCSD